MPSIHPPPPPYDIDDVLYAAGVEGLLLPGAGHFKIDEPASGGALVAARLVGIGITVYGAVDDRAPFWITGAATIFATYLADLIGAPIKAREKNEERAKGVSLSWLAPGPALQVVF
jgi:hypothetical protein